MSGELKNPAGTSGQVHIGISGWRYKPWRGVFYPSGLRQADELHFASSAFPTLEINGTFYSLQRPASFERWYDATPPGFVFAIKGPRYITHMLRLRNADKAMANFFASGIFKLREKIGPLLWQLPPSMRYDPELIERFFSILPRDTGSALRLARKRERRMIGRSSLTIDSKRPIRHAVEVRHSSFLVPSFVRLLRRHEIALVVADSAGKWPKVEDITTDFLYVRLHGEKKLYTGAYSARALTEWSQRITLWRNGRQSDDATLISRAKPRQRPRSVYCYFDNDAKVNAPFDAKKLIARTARDLLQLT